MILIIITTLWTVYQSTTSSKVFILDEGASKLKQGKPDNETMLQNTPVIFVKYWDPPLWHTTYYNRLGCNTNRTNDKIHATKATFTYLPWPHIPRNTLTLDVQCIYGGFEDSFQDSIQNGTLEYFYTLLNLSVRGCEIVGLQNDSMKGMNRLGVLSLYNNGLEFISEGFMINLPQLYWLRIQENRLKTISPYMFVGNTRLMFVQLRGNKISNILNWNSHRNESFENFPKLFLNSLVLESNRIRYLQDYAFMGYGLYGILSLSNCRIEYVSRKAFHGVTDVIAIDLSKNFISDLPDNVFSSTSKSLQMIHFNDNRLRLLNLYRFSALKEITHLRFNNNRLRYINGSFSQFPKLLELEMGSNFLMKISNMAFSNMTLVQKLILRNNKINIIEARALSMMTDLNDLDISYNYLQSISISDFAELRSLVYLNLRFNIIRNIEQGAFKSCHNLVHLDLSNNKIKILQDNVFVGTSALLFLKVSFNNLYYFSPKAFGESNCYITTCNFKGIDAIPISKLLLYGNILGSIELTVKTPNLTRLDLDKNKLTSIGNFLLSSTSLADLSLRDNNLASLDLKTAAVHKLEKLDIGGNNLTDLNSNLLSGLFNVQFLYADDNNINSVDTTYLRNMTSLSSFSLAKNNLHCECSLVAFQEWISTISQRIKVDHITCKTKDGTTHDVQDFSLAYCKNLVLYITISLAAFLGVLCISIIVAFRYRHEIQVLVYCKWGIRINLCCRKHKHDEIFSNDGFVSFVHENDDFVLKELRPYLEDHNEYRLLIHYRDFEVGGAICDNILDSINNSARIIIVLSKAFTQSKWGTFEFEQALHSIVKKKTQSIIVIVMDNDVLKNPGPNIVKTILTTKTYVRRDDKLFWKKLLFAMPDRRRCKTDNASKGITLTESDFYSET